MQKSHIISNDGLATYILYQGGLANIRMADGDWTPPKYGKFTCEKLVHPELSRRREGVMLFQKAALVKG